MYSGVRSTTGFFPLSLSTGQNRVPTRNKTNRLSFALTAFPFRSICIRHTELSRIIEVLVYLNGFIKAESSLLQEENKQKWKVDVEVLVTRPARTKSYHTVISNKPPTLRASQSRPKKEKKYKWKRYEIIQSALLIHQTPPHVHIMSTKRGLELSTNELGESLSAERLGALNGRTESTVDDQLGQNTQSTRHTEEDSVVIGLSQAVVLQEDTGVLKQKSLVYW